jgi:hypothetical protein
MNKVLGLRSSASSKGVSSPGSGGKTGAVYFLYCLESRTREERGGRRTCRHHHTGGLSATLVYIITAVPIPMMTP